MNRLTEIDDIHLQSCVTPSAGVVPVALMLAAQGATADAGEIASAGATPVFVDIVPGGRYMAADVDKAGGIPVIAKRLLDGKYVDGSAWHFYAGSITALGVVHNAFPNKNVYFTEFYTASTGDFASDLAYHLKNIIIGSTQNWSRNAIEWNLASDPNYEPHTPGG